MPFLPALLASGSLQHRVSLPTKVVEVLETASLSTTSGLAAAAEAADTLLTYYLDLEKNASFGV